MFLRIDIVEFINKIINSTNTKEEEVIKNINEFYKYLQLTKMADKNTLDIVKKIIDCLPEIMKLKQKCGNFDICSILNEQKQSNTCVEVIHERPIVKEKHYNHYQYDSSSSCGCGSSRSGC